MKILVLDTYDEVSSYAAGIIAKTVQSKPKCVLGLAAGATMLGVYNELADLYKNKQLDFSLVTAFTLDEYLGIGIDLKKPYDLDQSFARFMHEELFKHINCQKENIHIPNGLAKDTKKLCTGYESEIIKAGGIDLQLLGIGRNGHLAFNEPGTPFSSRTHIQKLDDQTLNDNYNRFYKKSGIPKNKMPDSAITMGISTILEARQILLIATGINKAGIIAQALEGPITPEIPASIIQSHQNTTVLLDRQSSSLT